MFILNLLRYSVQKVVAFWDDSMFKVGYVHFGAAVGDNSLCGFGINRVSVRIDYDEF